jgi:hypothetical protein
LNGDFGRHSLRLILDSEWTSRAAKLADINELVLIFRWL